MIENKSLADIQRFSENVQLANVPGLVCKCFSCLIKPHRSNAYIVQEGLFYVKPALCCSCLKVHSTMSHHLYNECSKQMYKERDEFMVDKFKARF